MMTMRRDQQAHQRRPSAATGPHDDEHQCRQRAGQQEQHQQATRQDAATEARGVVGVERDRRSAAVI
jgi:hypothetical protein